MLLHQLVRPRGGLGYADLGGGAVEPDVARTRRDRWWRCQFSMASATSCCIATSASATSPDPAPVTAPGGAASATPCSSRSACAQHSWCSGSMKVSYGAQASCTATPENRASTPASSIPSRPRLVWQVIRV